MYIEKDYLTVEDAPKVCSLFPDLEQEIRKAYKKKFRNIFIPKLIPMVIVFSISIFLLNVAHLENDEKLKHAAVFMQIAYSVLFLPGWIKPSRSLFKYILVK